MTPKRLLPVSQFETDLQEFVSVDTEMDLRGVAEMETPARSRRMSESAGPPAGMGRVKEINGKVYRLDGGHQRFESSEMLTEPRIHLSVKTDPPAQSVDIENYVQRRMAIRVSRGHAVQPIVVSPFEGISPDPQEISQLPSHPETAFPVITHQIQMPVSAETVWQTVPDSTTERLLAGGAETALPGSGISSAPLRDRVSPRSLPNSDEMGGIAAVDSTSVIRAAWEVQEFRWPDTVLRLCKDHQPAFARLVESLHLHAGRGPARIGVVHSHPRQGATTLATCMARLLAASGAKVLLADLDFEDPFLEEAANIKLQGGWQDLEQGSSIGEYLVREKASGVTLMPLRREMDLISRRRGLLKIVKKWGERLPALFDFSLFDIGNVRNLMVEENCHVGFLDGVVIVSDASGPGSIAVSIYEKLIAAGIPSVVIAENFGNQFQSAA